MRTSDVVKLLREKFCAPTHAIFFEVSDATGARGTGWADAITMSLWPSHGLNLEGYEIKVSRSDWQRELANPLKAEKFAQRCDKWWLVSAEGVVKDATEIPENWGWMIATPDGLVVKRQATKNDNVIPMNRLFLASIMRGAGKAGDAEIEATIEQRMKRLKEANDKEIEYQVSRRAGRKGEDTVIMDKVRELLGTEYIYNDTFMQAVAVVYKTNLAAPYGNLRNIAEQMEEMAKKIRAAHESLGLPSKAKK